MKAWHGFGGVSKSKDPKARKNLRDTMLVHQKYQGISRHLTGKEASNDTRGMGYQAAGPHPRWRARIVLETETYRRQLDLGKPAPSHSSLHYRLSRASSCADETYNLAGRSAASAQEAHRASHWFRIISFAWIQIRTQRAFDSKPAQFGNPPTCYFLQDGGKLLGAIPAPGAAGSLGWATTAIRS